MDGVPGRMPGSDALKFFKYDTDFQNVNQIRALTTLAQRERGGNRKEHHRADTVFAFSAYSLYIPFRPVAEIPCRKELTFSPSS
jgi:hypothetical protein